MGNRNCEICGSTIEPKYSMCRKCKESEWYPPVLLLKDTFYQNNRLRKEVYQTIPELSAKLFAQGNMGMNKLRAFFCMIRNAYDTLILNRDLSIDDVRPQLWALQRAVEDRTRRGVTPESFRQFVRWYVRIAEKRREELYGFMELFRSVIAYSR